jgi:hypothetical protein
MGKCEHGRGTQAVKQKFLPSATHTALAKISNKNGTAKKFAKLLLAQPTRRGYPASDAGEAPEGTAGFLFFRPFFVERQRKGIQAGTVHARSCVRVRRRSFVKFRFTNHLFRAIL